MSTPVIQFQAGKAAIRNADFIAFVADRQTEQVLKSFVLEQAMPHVHIAIGNIDDAIAHLSKTERSPLFLLVDLHGSVMPLTELARLAAVCEPSVQVVALGDRNDVSLFRSLLKLGVRDYLVKPLTVELLKRTVNFADGKVSTVTRTRAGKTIAFIGSRGGVGVTTIALNLARHLAEDTHRRVAYVDLNLHGGAANCMLGIKSNNGLTDVLQNFHRLDPQYVERTLVAKGSRLFVLSSELDYGAPWLHVDGALTRVIELLCNSFHYVILDSGERNNPLTQEAFDHASRVYVVADRSVHSTRETLRLLRYVENREHNPPASLLLNNPNSVHTGKVQADDFMAAVGRTVLYEVPFEAKALSTAENLGEAPMEKSLHGFNQTIARIGSDLTGQNTTVTLSFLQKLGLRKA